MSHFLMPIVEVLPKFSSVLRIAVRQLPRPMANDNDHVCLSIRPAPMDKLDPTHRKNRVQRFAKLALEKLYASE